MVAAPGSGTAPAPGSAAATLATTRAVRTAAEIEIHIRTAATKNKSYPLSHMLLSGRDLLNHLTNQPHHQTTAQKDVTLGVVSQEF